MDFHSLGWGVAFGLSVTVGALSWQITDLRRRLDVATGAYRQREPRLFPTTSQAPALTSQRAPEPAQSGFDPVRVNAQTQRRQPME